MRAIVVACVIVATGAGLALADATPGARDSMPEACRATESEQVGTAAADRLTAVTAADGQRLFGLGGDDELTTTQDKDCAFGGDGNDTIDGREGALMHGEGGDDTLTGDGFKIGGDGDDTLTGSGVFDGGPGEDAMTGSGIEDSMFGGLDTDPESIRGAGRSDDLFGGPGDRLEGGTGGDVIRASGAARVVGGAGNDVIFSDDGKRQTVVCGPGTDRVSADVSDRLRGCERVRRFRAPGSPAVTPSRITSTGTALVRMRAQSLADDSIAGLFVYGPPGTDCAGPTELRTTEGMGVLRLNLTPKSIRQSRWCPGLYAVAVEGGSLDTSSSCDSGGECSDSVGILAFAAFRAGR